MIHDLMEKEVVRAGSARVRAELEQQLEQPATGSEGQDDIKSSDVEESIGKIDEWKAKEAEDLAGGGDKKPLWIPNDPVAALMQSVLEDYFFEAGIVKEPVLSGAAEDEGPGSNLFLNSTSRSWLLGTAQKAYEGWDPRWLSRGAIATLIRAFRGKDDYPKGNPPAIKFADRARLIVVGDWGSGLSGARRISTAMGLAAEQGIGEGREVHIIHLGDVYYTGFAREYDRKFIRRWPVGPFEKSGVRSWCLNGNHDMYSGGYGYFGHLLKNDLFRQQAGFSQFSLENTNWMLLGLDTSYQPADKFGMRGDVSAEQAGWAWNTLRRGEQEGKNGILFSHHQPFSAYGSDGPELRHSLQGPLLQDLVHGWFWGHEHRCAFYKKRHGIRYPCLVGHGGVPEFALGGLQPDSVIYEHQAIQEAGFSDTYLQFGFAVLDFDGKAISVQFISELEDPKPDPPIPLQWQKSKR